MKNVLFFWLIRVFVIVCAICLPATGLIQAQEVMYGDSVMIYVKDADENMQYVSINENGELAMVNDESAAVSFVIGGGSEGGAVQPSDAVELTPVEAVLKTAPGNVLKGQIAMESAGLYYGDAFMLPELSMLTAKDVFYLMPAGSASISMDDIEE